MASGFMVRSTPSPTRLQPARKAQAWRTVSWPEGIGRWAVRATLASRSRSTMSLKAQPAARITAAPIANSAISPRSGGRPFIAGPSARACQPGSSSSQVPAGRSNRPSLSHGRSEGGA